MRAPFVVAAIAVMVAVSLPAKAQFIPQREPPAQPQPQPWPQQTQVPMPQIPQQPVPQQPQPTGPRMPQQVLLDRKFKEFMVGEWTNDSNHLGMQIQTTVLYRADGSLVGTQTVTQYGTMQYPLKGTWSVTGIDENRFVLSLIVSGASGGSSSTSLVVVDRNTLLNEQTQETSFRTQ
ncbi:MAG: hypothetical protein HXY22_05300 [Alphaproteobacteria bacterium]|nr:hypothetical protein [Alphaproteobacteria bacterium]